MPFENVVAQHDQELTTAEKHIARELLSNPIQMAFLPAAEVANRAGVHESTVVRLAKKLGYSGYRALRADIQADHSPADRVRRRLAQAPELTALVSAEIEALNDMVSAISMVDLEKAARTLIQAERIYLFASGHATSLVTFIDRRLRRSGFKTVVLTGQGRDLAERLLTLTKHDAVLAFSFSHQPPGLASLLGLAAHQQAPTILISDTIGPFIRPNPDILIWAKRGAEGQFLTLTVPMVICNMLILTIARLDDGRSIENLERLSEMIRQFNNEGHALDNDRDVL